MVIGLTQLVLLGATKMLTPSESELHLGTPLQNYGSNQESIEVQAKENIPSEKTMSFEKGVEKRERKTSNLMKEIPKPFQKNVPVKNYDLSKNDPTSSYNPNPIATSGSPPEMKIISKRKYFKEGKVTNNYGKIGAQKRSIQNAFQEDGKVRTFKTKEEGERKMKEYEDRMSSFISPLKSTAEDLPSDPQHPMYGMDYFVPAFGPNYITSKDFYGSGDIDGDGDIDMDDYDSPITGTDPFNDGTHRGDTDLDGESGTPADKQIIWEYLQGQRTHINMWELETKAEQENHLEKALVIDPTSEIQYGSTTGWVCFNFRNQTFINFNGVYKPENSFYAEDNGTNLQYDLSHNGIFRIPLRNLFTQTKSGIAHAINFVYISEVGNENVKDLNKKMKIEPQTDEMFMENDNFSMDPNEYANETWYGYFYNNFSNEWMYASNRLCEYNLSDGASTLTFDRSGYDIPQLVTSFDPFKDVVYPEDKEYQYAPGIEVLFESFKPSNLLYPDNTKVEKTITTAQIIDEFNYTVLINHKLTAGKYTTNHFQTIKIYDSGVGIDEPQGDLELELLSNPVKNYFKVVSMGPVNDFLDVDVYDKFSGEKVQDNEPRKFIEGIPQKYELPNLSGLHYLGIENTRTKDIYRKDLLIEK